MTQNQVTSIRLSYEELVYLLRAMSLPNLPGMDKGPWQELTDSQASMLLEITGRCLLSRGLIGLDGSASLTIDPALQAVLHACVQPEKMLVLAYQTNDRSDQFWYYQVKEFTVRQNLPAQWIFQFDLSTETDWGWGMVEDLLGSCPSQGSETAFTVDAGRFEQARLLSSQDKSAAANLFIESGAPMDAAIRLVHAIQAARLRLLLQYTFQVRPHTRQDAVTVLAGEQDAWIINGAGSAAQYTIACLPEQKICQILTAMHKQLG